MSRRAFALLVCFACLPAAARADDGRPDARARPLFEAGREAYQAGRYREAAEAFERVFALTAHPFMLRNLGNCYAKLGERDKATAALREYLKLAPDAEDRADVEAMLATLEREAEPLAAPEPAAPAELTPPPAPTAPLAAAAPPAEASHGLLLGRTFTWVALGASVALGTTSAVLWSGANSDYARLARTCGAHGGCSEQQIAGVSHAVTAANITLGLSLAALDLERCAVLRRGLTRRCQGSARGRSQRRHSRARALAFRSALTMSRSSCAGCCTTSGSRAR